MSNSVLWQDLENWRKYGIQNNYNERSPNSFKTSDSKKERSWYSKGQNKGWLKQFKFSRKLEKMPFKTLTQWRDHGIQNEYDHRNPSSLAQSESKQERSWYIAGKERGWLAQFNFNRIGKGKRGQFATFKSWKQYGLQRNYHHRSPTSLNESKLKDERSWCKKGYREGWVKKFRFNKERIYQVSPFGSIQQWQEYGLKRNYNQRNSTSLRESKLKEERAWYSKGQKSGWLAQFNFANIGPRPSSDNSHLESFLENYADHISKE